MRSTLLLVVPALAIATLLGCDSGPSAEEGPGRQDSLFGISGDSAELNVIADEEEGGINQDPFVMDPAWPN
jgi:hypothetical protein